MQPIPFTAASAEEAVAMIRAKLGPEAVVLNVRRLPPSGLARLWQKPMIEVLACKPQAAVVEPDALAEFRRQLSEIREQVAGSQTKAEPVTEVEPVSEELRSDQWRAGSLLRKSGLMAVPAQRILDRLHERHGETPPATLGEEIDLTQAALAESWRAAPPLAKNSLHVMVGPAGSGKTTYLCKWLAQAVLMNGQSTRVWRLDGATANAAESLSVYCEILGAPSERIWQPTGQPLTEDIGFIDLPGVDWRKPAVLKQLAAQLSQFGTPHIHLVLNGAYDISILLSQLRAFSTIPIADIVITHLDEEGAWGKIWNLLLGTNYSIRHLCAGQNIPGDFSDASAEMIFRRQFPKK